MRLIFVIGGQTLKTVKIYAPQKFGAILYITTCLQAPYTAGMGGCVEEEDGHSSQAHDSTCV